MSLMLSYVTDDCPPYDPIPLIRPPEPDPPSDDAAHVTCFALVFVGVGLAVLGNVATFVAEVRRASTVR